MKKDIEAKINIEKLILFGLENDLINGLDEMVVRNNLLDTFNLQEPYNKKITLKQNFKSIHTILENLSDYAYENGLIKEKNLIEYDLFKTKIISELMPRQSEINKYFWDLAKEESILKATNWFYELNKNSNYIKENRIRKNMKWKNKTEYGEFKITINLSKPEKDPKDIKDERNKKSTDYPTCPLCIENIGYSGRTDYPPRQNHRIISLNLANEEWFFQYSPYSYYNEHSIVISKEHQEMNINKKTFIRLIDFLEIFPHYFIGSNADLPLVGGSILNHNHFQAGRYIFPMDRAEIHDEFISKFHPDVEVSTLKWPLSVIRLKSMNKSQLIDLSNKILCSWREYNNIDLNIKSYSFQNNKKVYHNTITPIARVQKELNQKIYKIDIVLRNNRKSQKYPEGIFHSHKKFHHIKKENIGLIEVMGLAILPGRLKKELKLVEAYLSQEEKFDSSCLNEIMDKHRDWIKYLFNNYNFNCRDIESIIKKEVTQKFKDILNNCGVFKNSREGFEGFKEFLKGIDIV